MQEQKNKSIFKTYLIYFIVTILFCCVRIISSLGWLDGIPMPFNDIVFSSVIQILIMFLIPFSLYMIFLKQTPKQVFKTCNYSRINIQTILISIGLGIVLFLINLVVSSIFNGALDYIGYNTPFYFGEVVKGDYSVGSFFLNVFLVAVLPALCEEFLHRGLLLQGTKHMGFSKAIIISSLCFGLIHFNIGQAGYAIVLGLIMGFASVVAKNIWVPIIMHFVNNFIAVYLEFAAENGWFLGNYIEWINSLGKFNLAIVSVACFTLLSIISVTMFYLIMQLYKQTMLKKVNRAIEKVYDKDNNFSDEPVLINRGKVIQEMLENNTMLNLNYEEAKSPIQIVMPKQKQVYKTSFMDNVFLICSLILAGLVTLFTLLWGFL